jgi:hypothetical protein
VGLHDRHLEDVREGTQRKRLPDVPHLALDVPCTPRTEVRDEAEVEGEALGPDVIPVDSNCREVGLAGGDGLHGAVELHFTQAVVQAGRLLRGHVLVHSDESFILQDSQGVRADLTQVCGYEQGCFRYGPESELGALLIRGQLL